MTCPTNPDDEIPIFNLPVNHKTRGVGIIEGVLDQKKVQLPLKSVQIHAKVTGRVAQVEVKQTFTNKRLVPIEAAYIFPLSPGSAVSKFQMMVGKRVIEGRVLERGAARQEYDQALEQGKRAALLEQERDDVFTMQVGNLPPGEEVTVILVYNERLPYFADGATELHLPLVVAPRYIPGTGVDGETHGAGVANDTLEVPDASRITPPQLDPDFDPKVGLGITVEVTTGAAGGLTEGAGSLTDLESSQHATKSRTRGDVVTITLAKTSERLDRDFILRWRIAQEKLRSSLIVHKGKDGDNYAMLTILPPKKQGYLGLPRDVVFLVDRSGSMGGEKMVSAAKACSLLLGTLGPSDRFAILAFDDQMEWLWPVGRSSAGDPFLAADEEELARADKFLHELESRGGTEMFLALHSALQGISKRTGNVDGRVPVIVILTDGEVGDEDRINKLVQSKLGDTRLFSVGICTAANRGLLMRMTSLGGGTAAFVTPGSELEEAMTSVGREIGTPLVVDMQIEKDGRPLSAAARSGRELGDLFEGRAVTTFFKVKDKSILTVTGRYPDGSPFSQRVKPVMVEMPAIAQLWAKARVQDLEDQLRMAIRDIGKIKNDIVDLCVKHTLLSRFTSFVVVDPKKPKMALEGLQHVVQPVELPQGMAHSLRRCKLQASGAAMPYLGNAWGSTSLKSLNNSGAACFEAAQEQIQTGMWDALSLQQPAPSGAAPGQPPQAPPSTPMAMQAPVAPAAGGGQTLFDGALHWWMDLEPGAQELANPATEADVKQCLERFALALEKAYEAIARGSLPEAQELDEARAELVKVLFRSPLGMRVPDLQKFLRGAAVELVASLKAEAVLAAGLEPLWKRHREAFLEAQTKATTQFASSAGSQGSVTLKPRRWGW